MQLAKIKGGMQPQNLEEAFSLAARIAKSAIVPKNYRDKPDDILVSIMLGAECGLSAIQSLQNIAVINGRPSIYGDAMLALVQNSASFESIKESFDSTTMTATCTVVRKGCDPHTVSFSQKNAERAGLWSTTPTLKKQNYQTKEYYEVDNTSPWFRYPERMLQMRARGFALRDQFSDALLGLISREEAEDFPKDITNETYIIKNEDVPAKEVKTELAPLPEMSEARFNANMTQYESLINSNKKTNAEVIYTLQGKYSLTPKQIKKIESIKL